MTRSLIALACVASLSLAAPAHAESEGKAIVEAFFATLEEENPEAAFALLSPDAVLVAPYNPNGDASDAGIRRFPARLYVEGAIATYDNLVFTERAWSFADGGRTIWVEAEGRLRVAQTGAPYENRYVFRIDFAEDGRIETITEYTNVATLARDGVTAQAPQ